MSLRIERNDITQMDTEAIVNTAGENLEVGPGCDTAVYTAAGFEKLREYREKYIGCVPEGEVFLTPGFDLKAKYIIHAVSPLFIDGESGEEEKLRSCYRKSLSLAVEKGIKSIAFPLISTGAYGYPMADGLQIAVEEIKAFLLLRDIDVTLVVFANRATGLAQKIFPKIREYIDSRYVERRREEEYVPAGICAEPRRDKAKKVRVYSKNSIDSGLFANRRTAAPKSAGMESAPKDFAPEMCMSMSAPQPICEDYDEDYEEVDTTGLKERLKHISDPFGTYVMYLAEIKGLSSVDVQNRAWITKGLWFKIKSNPEKYKPEKITAFKLCIGLGLSLDESKDLLARAGIVFSPALKDDLIWQFCIENGLDVLDTSDVLEEFGFPSIIPI